MADTSKAVASERFSIVWKEAEGYWYVKVGGFWSVEDFTAFNKAIVETVAKVKRPDGRSLLLVDAVDSPVQNSSLLDLARQSQAGLTLPGDRVAIVLESSLLKMQIRRVPVQSRRREFFDSIDAARDWLIGTE